MTAAINGSTQTQGMCLLFQLLEQTSCTIRLWPGDCAWACVVFHFAFLILSLHTKGGTGALRPGPLRYLLWHIVIRHLTWHPWAYARYLHLIYGAWEVSCLRMEKEAEDILSREFQQISFVINQSNKDPGKVLLPIRELMCISSKLKRYDWKD